MRDELDTVGFVRWPTPFATREEAWKAARATVENVRVEFPLTVIGDFVIPPIDAPSSRDFQTLHFDFGLPLVPVLPADVARFTALYIGTHARPSDALTRLVPIRPLVARQLWPDRRELVRRCASYGHSHGAWDDAAGYVEGSLARIIEAALGGHPVLPSVKTDPQFLCGTEFASLAAEAEFFAHRSLNLHEVEIEVGLGPGELLVFDNLAVAHGRRGTRRPGELNQRVFGHSAVAVEGQLRLRNRVLDAFAPGSVPSTTGVGEPRGVGGPGVDRGPRRPGKVRSMPEDYFGERVARRYDEAVAEMFDVSQVEPAVEFLADMAGSGRVLELGIGTGRIALPLAERGVRVHGVDLSPAMVDRLRAKPGGSEIPVTIGDFATAAVPGKFALAYLLFNTIMNLTTIDEQVACFQNVAAHLEEGGRFVVEVGVPQLQRLPPGETVHPFNISESHLGFDEYDVASQRLVSHHYSTVDGKLEVRSIPFRYVWPAELDLMAQLAGMALRERWSNWHRESFTSESAQHISVWEKAPQAARIA